MWLLTLFVITVLVYNKKLYAQTGAEEVIQERFCQVYTTCDSCIQAESYCTWCYQQGFNSDRCGPKSALLKYGCQKIFLSDENTTIVRKDSDKEFHDVTDPDNVEESVQIKPQWISAKMHLKEKLNFQFKYRLAKNYPLDLYYLMDLTYTMEHDVATMANLGMELTEVLKKLTTHYRVAFGYYSDKVAMPFSKMTEEFLKNPCTGSGKKCKQGFDFVHDLNFTSNIDKFIEKIGASKTTSNLDNLEGGMDALFQIIICNNHIQWRKNSRKIIVVATDGTLHFAGDGILAGIVKRNPGRCFLNDKGIYSRSLEYDYPSLDEIYHRLSANKMYVLFAAKNDILTYYYNLTQVIPDVSHVGQLEEKSTNFLKLVEEGYLKLVKNVKFSANHSEYVNVTFRTTCNKTMDWNISQECDNVELGKEYLFDVTVELLQMPMDRDKEMIRIQEKNIAEELFVEIEYVGKCKCDDGKSSSKACSNNGIYKCGVCECFDEWKGEKCDKLCTDELSKECREETESFTSSTCYGHGDCDCGKCLCDEEYTGKFCQERQCPKEKNGKVCSGFFHGICHDGTCECRDSYTGPDCSCPRSTKNCIPPGNLDLCSRNGECKCGKCICNNDYSGDYCEICVSCTKPSQLCDTYKECALDTAKNITKSEKCVGEDGTIFMPQMTEHSLGADIGICYVKYERDDGFVCTTQYQYKIRKHLIVDLQIYNQCYKPLRASILITIIIASILGVGILFILGWKAKLKNDDRHEYAKFQQELDRNKMLGENPLYNSPIRTYQMPSELRL